MRRCKRKFRRAKPRWTQASERNKQLTSACVQCVQCVQSSAHMPRQRRKKGSKKLGIRNRVRPREKREKSRDTPRLERRCRQAAGAWACISQAEASENRQSTRMGVKKKVCTEGNTMHLSLSLALSLLHSLSCTGLPTLHGNALPRQCKHCDAGGLKQLKTPRPRAARMVGRQYGRP